MKTNLKLTIYIMSFIFICTGLSLLTLSVQHNNDNQSKPPITEEIKSTEKSSESPVSPPFESAGIFTGQTMENIYINSEAEKTGINKETEIKNISTEQSSTPRVHNKIDLRKALPILYYHAVNDNITGIEELFTSPADFEKQMEFLKNEDYEVITFNDIPDLRKFKKPVIITFDDGYEDNYVNAYPILEKYGFRATVFLITDALDKPLFLKKEQIEKMKDLINFQSHTVTHPSLSKLKDGDIEHELSDSKAGIEKLTGTKVDVFAYPLGEYDDHILKITKKYYRYAVTINGGFYHEGDDDLEMNRIYIPRGLKIEGFKNKLGY